MSDAPEPEPTPLTPLGTTVGDRIVLRRRRLRLEQGEIAATLHVNRNTVSSWELDRTEPKASQAVQLADLLGVSLDWLLRGERRDEDPGVAPRSRWDSRRRGESRREGDLAEVVPLSAARSAR